MHESQVTINCQNGQLKEYRLGWLGWAAGLAAGAGDTHRTNVEQLYTETSFLIILTGTNIKPKIFPHNKLNKNVRFMPVVIVILSVQLSLAGTLLLTAECRVSSYKCWQFGIEGFTRLSHLPSHLEIQWTICQVSGLSPRRG